MTDQPAPGTMTVRERMTISRTSTDKYSYETTVEIVYGASGADIEAIADGDQAKAAVAVARKVRENLLREVGAAVKGEIAVRKALGESS